MKIEFTGRNFTVSPAIKKHVTGHFKKLDTLLDSADRAHIILSVGKHHRHIAEIVINWKDHSLTSKSDTTDMYVSASQAIDRLHRQALKLKGKIIDRKHHATPITKVASKANGKGPRPADAIEAAAARPRIVRSRRYTVKPMTPEEAMMRVEDAAEQFLVFRNAETDRVGVLYKRKDGNFGLIEP
ncbi:MAG: ribosome hibernation-promoting factor, HPF/YfiA family [Blastocatellia bacterium]